MEGEELMEQETALYDRKIRVWAVMTERNSTHSDRLNFTILMEWLHHQSTEPPQVEGFSGEDDPSSFSAEFFSKFDAVVVSGCSFSAKKSINEKCRKSSRRVSFYSVDCRDSCEVFVDLQDYTYTKRWQKKLDEPVQVELKYPSFQAAVAIPRRKLPREVSKLYFAMRVIEKFEETEGRNPGDVAVADLPGFVKSKKELCDVESLNEAHFPNSLLERLLAGRVEFPPVCAIIGGFLGQVIKGIPGKGDPLKNFFFFDAFHGRGVIEDISFSDSGN